MSDLPPSLLLAVARDHYRHARLGLAEDVARLAIGKDPANTEPHLLLAAILTRRHGPYGVERAVSILQAFAPTHADTAPYQLALGQSNLALGRWQDAIQALRRATELAPDNAEAHDALGIALRNAGEIGGSLAAHERDVAIRPEVAEAHYDLGVALAAAGRHEQAAQTYARAAQLEPSFSPAHYNLGVSLTVLRDWDASSAAFLNAAKSATTDSDKADAFANLGASLREACHVEAAILAFDRAVELNPDLAAPHWNRAQAHLALGHYEQGWPEFHWRTRLRDRTRLAFDTPEWTGQDLAGKRLFLYWEMGLGDTIHFARYAPRLAAQGALVTLDSPPELKPLLSTLEGITHVDILGGDRVPPHDYHCSLMSIPAVLKPGTTNGPATWGNANYLTADAEKVAAWQTRLHQGKRRIGLAWAGNPLHQNDVDRSIPPALLHPLAQIKNTTWISLQFGPRRTDLAASFPLPIHDPMDEVHDFSDTAALIANLDAVVTVDTSIAHLAASLNRPTHLLLQASPDWRWRTDGATTPWYPAITIHRQRTRGDWQAAILEASRALGH